MTLADFFAEYAIPSDQPVNPNLDPGQHAEMSQRMRELGAFDEHEPVPSITSMVFAQLELPVYLGHLRQGVEPNPGIIVAETLAAAGWPEMSDHKDHGLRFWDTNTYESGKNNVALCIENVALILEAADDPASVVTAAGFADVDQCIAWALTLPPASTYDTRTKMLGDFLRKVELTKAAIRNAGGRAW